MTTKEKRWRVNIVEYELGWGSRVDSVEKFETKELALQYQKQFNSKNTDKTAPDWYMVAEDPYYR